MCGRYYIADEEEIIEMREILREVNQRYANRPELALLKTGEVFPTNVAPVLLADQDVSQAGLMAWGFPRWEGSGVVINARSETAAEKPMFKGSVGSKRCIIPATGFFEWDHAAGHTKDKYLLRQKNSPLLYMAGLYAVFADPHGLAYAAFVILTTEANATVRPIHDRMPLIIESGQTEQWLHDESYARSMLKSPCAAEMIMIG